MFTFDNFRRRRRRRRRRFVGYVIWNVHFCFRNDSVYRSAKLKTLSY